MAVREERSDATSRGNPLLSFAREHIALLAPFIGALMFALRCLAVSRGDPYVASMLAVQTSIGDAVRALLQRPSSWIMAAKFSKAYSPKCFSAASSYANAACSSISKYPR
jgi:hypothetical protein